MRFLNAKPFYTILHENASLFAKKHKKIYFFFSKLDFFEIFESFKFIVEQKKQLKTDFHERIFDVLLDNVSTLYYNILNEVFLILGV